MQAFSEDVATRFISYGWNVTRVSDANDLKMLTRAIQMAKVTSDRPTLIIADSHIAWGVPGKLDTAHAHGDPLGRPAIKEAKEFSGCPNPQGQFEPSLFDGVYEHFQQGIGNRGKHLRDSWMARFAEYRAKYPELADAPDGKPDVLFTSDARYREQVLPSAVTARVALEQASTLGGHPYVGLSGTVLGMRTFGASAPLKELQKLFGYTVDKVASATMEQLKRAGEM